MKLDHVSDHDLLNQIGRLVGSERELTAQLVAYLAELEERRLHLVQGFSSLFEFCLKQLRLSEGEAFRRIVAARLGRRFPVVFALIASGAVHLSALELLRERLTDENHAELLEAASGKSKREVEALIAARFPVPDVPSRIRRLPARRAAASKPEPTQVAPISQPVRGAARVEPLSESRFKVEFTASAELREKLELARDLMSHSNPSRDLGAVVERAVDLLLGELERKKFGKTRTKRTGASRSATKPGRVSHSTRREVAERDGLCCTYVSPGGRRCSARAFLELDHAEPRALGGGDQADNIRMCCRAHNQLLAEQSFGRGHIARRRHLRQQKRPSSRVDAEQHTETSHVQAGSQAVYAKLFQALTSLGFRDSESRRLVAEVARNGRASDSVTLEQLLREALLAVELPVCRSAAPQAPRAPPAS